LHYMKSLYVGLLIEQRSKFTFSRLFTYGARFAGLSKHGQNLRFTPTS
jgi:hypothetical protein